MALRRPVMAQAGKGAGRQQQQGLQESVLHSVIHPLHPSDFRWPRQGLHAPVVLTQWPDIVP